MKGYEYTAKYNLGHDVPFIEFTDKTGKYHHTQVAERARGRFRAVWEIAYHHYRGRKNLEMPWTKQVLERIRPEGEGNRADHPGFGTLLFTLPGPRCR